MFACILDDRRRLDRGQREHLQHNFFALVYCVGTCWFHSTTAAWVKRWEQCPKANIFLSGVAPEEEGWTFIMSADCKSCPIYGEKESFLGRELIDKKEIEMFVSRGGPRIPSWHTWFWCQIHPPVWQWSGKGHREVLWPIWIKTFIQMLGLRRKHMMTHSGWVSE